MDTNAQLQALLQEQADQLSNPKLDLVLVLVESDIGTHAVVEYAGKTRAELLQLHGAYCVDHNCIRPHSWDWV